MSSATPTISSTGSAVAPKREAEAFLAAHPDLYHAKDGRVRLHVDKGSFAIGSLDCVGFGSAALPDLSATEPMPPSQWPSEPGDKTT